MHIIPDHPFPTNLPGQTPVKAKDDDAQTTKVKDVASGVGLGVEPEISHPLTHITAAKSTGETAPVKDILANQEKIISQMKDLIACLPDGWEKERLIQRVKFVSGPTLLDDLWKQKLKEMSSRFGDPIEDIEKFFNENVKKIKKNDLERVFRIATASCYNSIDCTNKKIIVTGEVSSDGWGDYFQMWLTAKNLHDELPGAKIAVSTRLGDKKPPQISKSYEMAQNLTYTTAEDRNQKGVEEELKAADLLINIPHGYAPNPGQKPSIRVEEYGFNTGGNFALGLEAFNTDILGIPLTVVSSAESLQELSHQELRKLLTEKNRPYFLAYLKTDHGNEETNRAGFVLAAAISQTEQPHDIDILCPFDEIHKLDLETLKAHHVSRVVFIDSSKGGLHEKETLTLQPQGKEIRIINPFPLNNDDWLTLLKFSETLVGCTGDMSFSEVITNGKLPFYQIRWHKVDFINQILEMTGYVYKEEFPRLNRFLEVLKKGLVETAKLNNITECCQEMGLLLDEELVAETKKFSQLVQQCYATNKILAAKAKRELAFVDHPELKTTEQEIIDKWHRDEITLQEGIAILNSHLNKAKNG